MATDATSRWGWALRLLFVVLVLVPVLVQFGGVFGFDPLAVDSALVVRALGLGVVLGVVALLFLQKRRSRGQRVRDAPEQAEDRETEGTGEVYSPYAYNNQQKAKREGERIRRRAEEVSEADRDARKRR